AVDIITLHFCGAPLTRLMHLRIYNNFILYHDPATADIYTLSLHDALPISRRAAAAARVARPAVPRATHRRAARSPQIPHRAPTRSEEHTSELQSRENLVCRLLLEKKKDIRIFFLTLLIFSMEC